MRDTPAPVAEVAQDVDRGYNSVAEVKRFLELWTSVPEFKELVARDPDRAVREHKLEVDPEAIKSIYDAAAARAVQAGEMDVHPAARRYGEFVNHKVSWRTRIREECEPSDPRFKAWRERQMARYIMQVGASADIGVIHTPVGFELTKGCSVGCWFCAFDAPPLTDVFHYTPPNARLWREVLHVVLEVIGPAARRGTSYHATEPLDNPDYERFCDDFHEILGMYPQTTTALPLREVDRVKALLEVSEAKGTLVNRFSILSPAILRQVHDTFTAEELRQVELIIQTKHSGIAKAAAGRLREKMKRDPRLGEWERAKIRSLVAERADPSTSSPDALPPDQPGSIACITGFLFSMPDRKVTLISPCPASERWPLGYVVFDEGTFADAEDLRRLLERMIASNMPLAVGEDDRVRFRPDLEYESLPKGFEVATHSSKITVENERIGSYLKNVGDMIRAGDKTAGQIGLVEFYQSAVPIETTVGAINMFFKNGLLDEEPG